MTNSGWSFGANSGICLRLPGFGAEIYRQYGHLRGMHSLKAVKTVIRVHHDGVFAPSRNENMQRNGTPYSNRGPSRPYVSRSSNILYA